MKRIALIRSASSKVSKNGYNIQEIGLAKELARLGMRVHVFLISDTGKTYYEDIDNEGMIRVFWLKGYKIPGQQGFYPEMLKILDENVYDLIQALDDSQITTVLISRYCKKKQIKFVLWQGMYENYPERYKRIIQYFYDRTLLKVLRKNTKYCIAKTTSAKEYLSHKQFENIRVIPVGLELTNFVGIRESNFRQELGISQDKRILLYVGKVEERRKPIFCMDVYQKVRSENENCCLVYVGKGPLLESTRKYVDSNKIEDVYFIESIPQTEIAELYAISDMFILPTRYEIFGMVLLEAMYFSVPVITYKAAGPIDVVENGIDSIVMDSFDEEQWSEAIKLYLFSDEGMELMKKKAKNKIENTYTWSIIGKKYYDAYMDIINK